MKKITTVYVSKELLEKAKKLRINISQLLETCLEREIARLTNTPFKEFSSKLLEEFENEIYQILSIVLLPDLIPDKLVEEIARRYGAPIDTVREKAKYLSTTRLWKKEHIYTVMDWKTGIHCFVDPDRNRVLIDLISLALNLNSVFDFSTEQLINIGKILYGTNNDKAVLERTWRFIMLVRSHPQFFEEKVRKLMEIQKKLEGKEKLETEGNIEFDLDAEEIYQENNII